MKIIKRYIAYVFCTGVLMYLFSSVAVAGEVKWANTGHMTLDGKLEVGIHAQEYALDGVEYLDIEANNNYVYALMSLVSYLQRGVITPGQKRWLYERAIMSAVPRNMIDEFMAFEHAKAHLADHMMGSGGDSIARVLLYDVTQMITFGDLYDRRPRKRNEYYALFGRASKQLGVPSSVAAQIRRIVKVEARLLKKKKVLFWGATPYTPPK